MSTAATRPPEPDLHVEIVGKTDGARAFWQAFASIAADLLKTADDGDLLRRDPPEETRAA